MVHGSGHGPEGLPDFDISAWGVLVISGYFHKRAPFLFCFLLSCF